MEERNDKQAGIMKTRRAIAFRQDLNHAVEGLFSLQMSFADVFLKVIGKSDLEHVIGDDVKKLFSADTIPNNSSKESVMDVLTNMGSSLSNTLLDIPTDQSNEVLKELDVLTETWKRETNELKQIYRQTEFEKGKSMQNIFEKEHVVDALIKISIRLMGDSFEMMKEDEKFKKMMDIVAEYYGLNRDEINSEIVEAKEEYQRFFGMIF